MKKALMVATVTTAVGLASVIGIGAASAATTSSTSTSSNGVSSLVKKLAEKFNLKEADVQAVFDENRTEMEANREASLVSQQAQLVKDGKLTQAQSDAITAKRAELKKEREANRTTEQSKSDTERKSEMETRKTALDTWLKSQNIDTTYAHLLMGGRGGHGGPGKTDKMPSTTSDTTNTTTDS